MIEVTTKYPEENYDGYAVVLRKHVTNRKLAEDIANRLAEEFAEHLVEVVPQAGRKCPGGYDHAHEAYDGATWCDGCQSELGTPQHRR